MILAMRCYLYFRGTNRMNNYFRVSSQLYFTLTIGDKPAFVAPCWYFPAGGGIDAGHDDGGSSANNGMPTQEAFMKLAKAIPVPVRQNFNVEGRFFAMGSTNALTGLNTGATDDEKCIQFYLDGVQTRDVQ